MHYIRLTLVLAAFVPIIMLLAAGEVSAQQVVAAADRKPCKEARGVVTNPDCLNESDIKPCEAILAKGKATRIEELKRRSLTSSEPQRLRDNDELNKISGMSTLQYALHNMPTGDLNKTKEFIQTWKQVVNALRSGDEREMSRVIGVAYRGKKLEERLAGDEVFLCMLNVRLKQIQAEPAPSTDRTSAPATKPVPTTTDSKQPTQSSSSKQPKEKKYHYPEYVATECLSLIKEKTLYGGFINSCPFKVAYGWCVEEPKKGGWSESAACGNETRGAGQVVGAKSRDGQHTKGGKKVHWVACMYEDRNGNFLDVGPRDVSWDGQKKQMKFRCGDLMPRK